MVKKEKNILSVSKLNEYVRMMLDNSPVLSKVYVSGEISNFKLDMKLSLIEYTLDREKVIVNYTAEGRVDFREIVKSLANKLKARIEMHQIGSRDEVQQKGAIGICGRECCCKAHLNDFDKVVIKMAKNQGLSLNPNNISGLCGKLLCCLAYENPYYVEVLKVMPKVNSTVSTPDGKGTVVYTDLLKKTVSVKFQSETSSEIKDFALEDIKFRNERE